MIFWRLPLRISIPLVLVVVAMTFQTGLSWYAFRESEREHTTAARDRISLLALILSAEAESQLRVGNRATVRDLMGHAASDRDVRASFAVDEDGRVALGQPVHVEGRLLADTEYAALAPLIDDCRRTLISRVVERPERNSLFALSPARAPRPETGFFPTRTEVLVIEYDLARERAAALREAWEGFARSGLSVLAVSFILWAFLRQAVLVRFQQLLGPVRRLGNGDFTARANITGQDELAELAREFDAMADRLEASQDAVVRRDKWFHEVIAHSSDVLLVLDSEQRIVFVGAAAESVLGLPLETLQGRPLAEFVDSEDAQAVAAALSTGEGDGGGLTSRPTVRVRRPDGEARLLELASARAMTPTGEDVLIVNARDVTVRGRLEEELFQSRKLQAVGQLAAGVAHDFNNLLTAIRGYSELLRLQLESRDDLLEMLGVIEESVDRGAALTQQLLLFGRKRHMQFRPLDLNEIVGDFGRLARTAVRSEVAIETDLQRPLASMIGDKVRLEQILLNLLHNASDAIEGTGTIWIETRNLDDGGGVVERSEQAAHVRLRIRDSGSGMDERTRQRLFEPFFTTKGPGEGTGLGLSVVYGTVQALGGTIDLTSHPGEGTTFDLVWPATSKAPVEVEPRRFEPAPLATGARVLVVDDEASVRRYLGQLLSQQGYEVFAAENGREALDQFRAWGEDLDVIVSDVMMPEMGGIELLETLVEDDYRVPMLLMSGYADRVSPPDLGADLPVRFIDKPFTANELLVALHETLSLGRQIC